MQALILTIICSTSLFIIFKILGKKQIPTFPVIVINYFFATLVGFFSHEETITFPEIIKAEWIISALAIGMLFIIFFYMISISSQKAGISKTSIACKISVVFPIYFSIIFYNEPIIAQKIIGIVLALIAILLITITKKQDKGSLKYIYFPILLFFGTGFLDSFIKYSEHKYLNNKNSAIFSAVLFLVAASIGLLVSLINYKKLNQYYSLKVWIWGLILGVCNFGSIYFFILSLKSKLFDSSITFGITNIGIICLSIFCSMVFFKERLAKINWIGIFLAIISIGLLSTM